MYVSVHERFPEWSERIPELLQSDANFDEMCADYEALANWLATHGHDGCTPEPECAENRQVLAKLEIEILRFLQAVDHQPGHQA